MNGVSYSTPWISGWNEWADESLRAVRSVTIVAMAAAFILNQFGPVPLALIVLRVRVKGQQLTQGYA